MKSLAYMVSVVTAALFATGTSAATVGYALGQSGATLIRFDAANPAGAVSQNLGVNLDAIDYRPATGQLFGYSSATDKYYTVDTATGVATEVSLAMEQTIAPTSGSNVDIDWNPTIDRMRTVGSNDENIVFNPNTGAAAAQTPLFYQTGDANFGVDPSVSGNAYTNTFAGAAATQQSVLHFSLNSIATLGTNAGTLGTLGVLTSGGSEFDFDANLGFDIATIAGTNVFYAILSLGGLSALFTIDIVTRELTQLGVFMANLGEINGLAIAPVPLPAGLLLFLTGGLGLGLIRNRRAKKSQLKLA